MSFDAVVAGLKRFPGKLLSDPSEAFAPGVRKLGRQNKPTSYIFEKELVGTMTATRYTKHLEDSGLLKENNLAPVLEEGDGKQEGQVIRLEGSGFRYSLPKVVFSGGEAYLEIPYSLEDQRDWDGIARQMIALFTA